MQLEKYNIKDHNFIAQDISLMELESDYRYRRFAGAESGASVIGSRDQADRLVSDAETPKNPKPSRWSPRTKIGGTPFVGESILSVLRDSHRK